MAANQRTMSYSWYCSLASLGGILSIYLVSVLVRAYAIAGILLNLFISIGAFCCILTTIGFVRDIGRIFSPGHYGRPPLWQILLAIPIWMFSAIVYIDIFCPFAFHSHSPRSKVARVKGDQRTITIALETYYLDHNAYPAWSFNRNLNAFAAVSDKKGVLQTLPTFRMQHGTALVTLTTPVAYLTSLFADPFSPVKAAPFCYWAAGNTTNKSIGYLIWSAGPDQVYDITMDNVAQVYDLATTAPSAMLLGLSYDPSNGTQSRGDVYRYKQ